MQFSSQLLENAVKEISKLPGIGKKTALRLVLHLLKQPTAEVDFFCNAITTMKAQVMHCSQCHNIADTTLCNICSSHLRKQDVVCVVENIKDVIAIEATQQYNGVYHVLGGIISPLDGIGPDQLNISTLMQRLQAKQVAELIFALNPTIQGDTTIYYIQKKIATAALPFTTKVTTIARGIAFGGELEYADEMTLARSLHNRLPVEQYVQN